MVIFGWGMLSALESRGLVPVSLPSFSGFFLQDIFNGDAGSCETSGSKKALSARLLFRAEFACFPRSRYQNIIFYEFATATMDMPVPITRRYVDPEADFGDPARCHRRVWASQSV